MVIKRGKGYQSKIKVGDQWVFFGLGTRDKQVAQSADRHIGRLASAARMMESPPPESMEWLRRQPEGLRNRLMKLGLARASEGARSLRIADHFEEWLAAQCTDTKNPAVMRQRLRRNVERVLESAGWTLTTEINPDGLMVYMERRRAEGAKDSLIKEEVMNAKRLTRWLYQRDRIDRDPLAVVSGVRDRTRREPIALSADEQVALVRSTLASEAVRKGMTGEERGALYWLALTTGMRRSELLSITPEHIDSNTGTIKLAPDKTKSGRRAVFGGLDADLVALLTRLCLKRAERPLWDTSKFGCAGMVRADADAAGIVTKREGRSLNFHDLRHTFATTLALSGVGVAVAQQMMRHSTAALTLDVYTHVGDSRSEGARQALPKLGPALRIG